MSNVHVTIACLSDVGRVRANNEDSFLVTDFRSFADEAQARGARRMEVGPRGLLLLVSDGMGGEQAGEVASALVVEEVARSMQSSTPASPARSCDAMLKAAVSRAHDAVVAAASARGRGGMGATLTAIHIHEDVAYVAEVGDSRAYLIRGGAIFQLTKDQNLAQLLIDSGTLNAEDASESFTSNILSQAMGHHAAVRPALGKLQLRDRDCLLLCSDGLTHDVTEQEIVDIVLREKTLDLACRELVALANKRGGKDNVTVVLAGVGGDLPAASVGDRISRSYEVLETFAPTGSEAAPRRRVPAPQLKVVR